jgi:hypothetical protein
VCYLYIPAWSLKVETETVAVAVKGKGAAGEVKSNLHAFVTTLSLYVPGWYSWGTSFNIWQESHLSLDIYKQMEWSFCQWFLVKWNGFLSIEMISFQRKWFSGKWNCFLLKETVSAKGNFFLSKDWFSVNENGFSSKEIISFQRKLYYVKEKGRQPYFFRKMEDDLLFQKMEENLYYLKYEGWPKFLRKWKITSIF